MSETITVPTTAVGDEKPPTEQPAVKTFTEADLAKARQEEKDKLYGRLQKMEQGWEAAQAELKAAREAREAEQQQVEEARKKAEADARKTAEKDMDAKSLLEQRQAEWEQRLAETNTQWEQRFASVQQEREREAALLEQERRFSALQAYTQRRVQEERDGIAPELLDFVSGNTEEEIENSIATVKAKSTAIVEAMQAAAQQQRANMRGVSPTGYATTGPMDTNSTHQTYTADDLKNMPMSEYAKVRGSLLGATAQQTNRGLYG